MLTDLGSEETKADLVELEHDDKGDVEWLILHPEHDSESQWVVEQDSRCVGGGLKLQELRRAENAAKDSGKWAKHRHCRHYEEERDTDRFPVIKRMEHVHGRDCGQEGVQSDEYGKAEEVSVASSSLGWDTMVLEAKHPEGVQEATEAQHLVLAGRARLAQCQLKALYGIIADVKGAL